MAFLGLLPEAFTGLEAAEGVSAVAETAAEASAPAESSGIVSGLEKASQTTLKVAAGGALASETYKNIKETYAPKRGDIDELPESDNLTNAPPPKPNLPIPVLLKQPPQPVVTTQKQVINKSYPPPVSSNPLITAPQKNNSTINIQPDSSNF